MIKLQKIDAIIQQTTDRKLLNLLNRAWWQEWFRLFKSVDEYECAGGGTTMSDAEQFPMPTLADALCNACQLLDSVKMDWEKDGCWSAWDQAVRDALSRELQIALRVNA